jgi:hypothetical protein
MSKKIQFSKRKHGVWAPVRAIRPDYETTKNLRKDNKMCGYLRWHYLDEKKNKLYGLCALKDMSNCKENSLPQGKCCRVYENFLRGCLEKKLNNG